MFRSSILASAAAFVVLAGCSLNIGGALGFGGSSDREAQAVADEPYAAKVGAAIMAQGGSAADAAAAMFFTLSATYPAGAGLGTGGVCVVRDETKNVSEEFVFLPRAVAGNDAFAVPAGVAGIAAMQHEYGTLPWGKVVSPAEGYARVGVPMTKALSLRVGDGSRIKADAVLSAALLDEAGAPKKVGALVANPALAETLAAIRLEGPQAMYSGTVAKAIVAYAAAQGHPISAEDLAAAYKVLRDAPQVIEMDDNYVFLPSVKSGAGAYLAALISTFSHTKLTAAKLEAASKQTSAKLNLSGAENGSSGFAAMDTHGQSVACTVTLNAPFGSARADVKTGVVLASASNGTVAALVPAIASASASGPAVFAGAASGVAGSNLMADVLWRLGHDREILKRADLHPLPGGVGDTGNMIVCDGDDCVALSDPSAFGLGVGAALPALKKK